MNLQTMFLDQVNKLDPYYNTKLFKPRSLTIEFLFKIIIIIIIIKNISKLNLTSTPILLKTKNKKIANGWLRYGLCEVVGLVRARFVGISGGSATDLVACGSDGWWLRSGL